MRRASLLLLSLLTLGQCAPKTDAPKTDGPKALPGKPVPAAWIEELRRYQYQADNLSILQGFERIIAPDTLDGTYDLPHEVDSTDPESGGLLGFMFANLDVDPATELIGVFGYHSHDPMLAVFKEIDHSWRLLYTEPFHTHDVPAVLQVGNTFSAHKPFYIRAVLGWGSGVYYGQYRFYKLIDNKVYPCLQLVERSYDEGWETSREVITRLQFSATDADELRVTYAYRFAPTHRLLPRRVGNDEHLPAFVEDDRGIGYHWNAAARRYEPDMPYTVPETGAMQDSAELNAAKLAYLADTGSDSLFLRAFGYELRQLRREGSPPQKQLLQKYLAALRQTDAERHAAQSD